ncbi:MAG: hypothetical protein IJZ39_12415 [Oscillospiraceae bacterium]|nr:hypothetical protein [Oscillospiraceae bacterium]
MKDEVLVKKVKAIENDEASVRSLLLELLNSGAVSTEQVIKVLDKPSNDFPKGLTFNKDPNFITESPSFIMRVITKYKRMNGNKKAFCC